MSESFSSEGAAGRVLSYRPDRLIPEERRKREGRQPIGLIRLSVRFAPEAAHAGGDMEGVDAERRALAYLERNGLRDLVVELEDSLPVGVEVGSVDVYEGTLELIVVLVAVYRVIKTFNEVVDTLTTATQTLRGWVRRSLAAPGVRLSVRGQFAPELVGSGASAESAVALPTLTLRTVLIAVGIFLGATTFLSLLAVLIGFLFSRF